MPDTLLVFLWAMIATPLAIAESFETILKEENLWLKVLLEDV